MHAAVAAAAALPELLADPEAPAAAGPTPAAVEGPAAEGPSELGGMVICSDPSGV